MPEAVILYVDPDTTLRDQVHEELQKRLSDIDLDFEACETVTEATSVVDSKYIDCLITEYELADGSGFELIRMARNRRPDVGTVLFTTVGNDAFSTTEEEVPVTEYLEKASTDTIARLARLVRTLVMLPSQRSYPLPEHDEERLAAINSYDIESDDLHRSLDRITDLAAHHFAVPTASVNIIDEHRQCFIGSHGRAKSWDPTPREEAICTFTILEDDGVMVVQDVTKDSRFETQSELEDLGIRAYMGATLDTSSGFSIGTLCIYDEEPRSFSRADRTYLRTLADVAMELIVFHSHVDQKETPSIGGQGYHT